MASKSAFDLKNTNKNTLFLPSTTHALGKIKISKELMNTLHITLHHYQ